jgi:pimeloyl-ACP methyl ester carboxylesterase
MSFSFISNDPEFIDLTYPAGCEDLVIESGGSRMFGVMYTPQGKGPHPTILLLHGFPGSERNFDLAQIFRRAGFNVVVFHYRGSWGSEGDFSFQHVLEDSETAIRYLLDPDNASRYSIDTSRFILMGHSMGGFSTLMSGARLPEVTRMVAIAAYNLGAVAKNRRTNDEYARETCEMFVECSRPLKGTDHDTLLEEIENNAEELDFCNYASGFKGKDLLVIAGARDVVSHPDIHHYPFIKALRENNIDTAEDAILDGSHSFHCRRVELATTILNWLKQKGLLPE